MQVGPRIELAEPASLLEDEEMCKLLPFLALPDGAHQVRPYLSQTLAAYTHLSWAPNTEQRGLLLFPLCSVQCPEPDHHVWNIVQSTDRRERAPCQGRGCDQIDRPEGYRRFGQQAALWSYSVRMLSDEPGVVVRLP